ncbi:MAG: sulfite oxidase [Candidatus Rokubacteria bacterium]|nr:sulfite oxidase [Candidatus Rokubacteria bacterium]
MLCRRRFLVATGAAGVTALLGRPAGAQAPAVPGKEALIVRSLRPVNLETPIDRLTTYLTGPDVLFVRNNYDAPGADAEHWTIRVDGEVDRSMRLELEDLRRLPTVRVDAVLECAGNGRALQRPRAPGIQWERGAVGNVRWTGVRLADVLDTAGVRPGARHVVLDGADVPPTDQAPDFARSIPLDKARDPRTIVALEMNGAPIPHLHGGPARVVVPGWTAAASVKWIAQLTLAPQEFDGPFMRRAFRVPAPGGRATVALPALDVKSVVVAPREGGRRRAGLVEVSGWAWAGEAELTGLDVSTDGGRTWSAATWDGTWERYSWRRWRYVWAAAPGRARLMARAADADGQVQPAVHVANPLGYRWNVIHTVDIDVV